MFSSSDHFRISTRSNLVSCFCRQRLGYAIWTSRQLWDLDSFRINLVSSLSSGFPPPFASIRGYQLICDFLPRFPCSFLVFSAPPTPPTFTASTKSLPFFPVLKMICGFGGPISSEAGVDGEVVGRESMSRRERFDFYSSSRLSPRRVFVLKADLLVLSVSAAVIAFCWTMVASALLSVESFIGQITLPYGYDSTSEFRLCFRPCLSFVSDLRFFFNSSAAGFMGAAIIAAGIVFTLAAAPLFDRVLVSHLAIALKSGATAVFFCFVGLVFAVERGNDGGLYGLFCVMGICGFSLSPCECSLDHPFDASLERS